MFDVADIWATRTGFSVRLVSGNDHTHARQSMHYAGLAVDLHSSEPDALAATMRRAGYRVLWRVAGHFNHLHVEVPDAVPVSQGLAVRRSQAEKARGAAVNRPAS